MRLLLTKSVHLRRAPKGGIAAFRGGQFITNVLWHEERAKARAALPQLLDSFGERLQFYRAVFEQNAALHREGVTKIALVPLPAIEAQMQRAVQEAYARTFLYGKRAAGNLTSATEAEQQAVQRLQQDEFTYLSRFLKDMKHGEGVMGYGARMDMYRAAARELFWLGFVLASEKSNRLITWRTGPTESCADCLRFEKHGPYSIAEFKRDVLGQGFLPQSGKLLCKGYHCRCRLEESFAK